MEQLDQLNIIIGQLQAAVTTIGLSLASLMIIISMILLLFNQDSSPAARTQRWEHFYKVLACALVIGGAGPIMAFIASLAAHL